MTSEMFQDAISLLPNDLIAATDELRRNPRKTVIRWRRWAALAACAVLVFGCGWIAARMLPGFSGGSTAQLAYSADMTAAECAPEAPAAMEPTEAAGGTADNSALQIAEDAEETPRPTYATPPVDVAGAEFRFAELSVADEIHLITNPADLEALGLDAGTYDESWFADFDLLLIALPGITSPEGLDFSVGQGMSPVEWEIRIRNLPEDRVDTADSLLICIPVQKGHIPRAATYTLIFD